MIFTHQIAKIVPRSLLLIFFGVVGFVTCEVLVADEKPGTLTIATWNLEWFYDDDTSDNESDVALELSSPSRAEWDWKKQQVATVIAEIKPFGNETPQGEVSIVRGLVTESPEDDLQDANERLAEDKRSIHITGRQYDRVFYSRPLGEDDPARSDLVLQDVRVRRDLVVRGEVDADHRDSCYKIPHEERDLSDHYPLVVDFEFR